MRKTLALLLAVSFFCLAGFPPVSLKSQMSAPASKFRRVANPIPNQYVVVLATTEFSPIAEATPAPVAMTSKVSAASSEAASPEASSPEAASPGPEVESTLPQDPEVVDTADDLTATYGGSFTLIWSVAIKGFLLLATEAQAIAMSNDNRVEFIQENGAIAVGTPDTDPIVMSPDPDADLNPQPHATWGLDRIDQRYLPLDNLYSYSNNGQFVNVYVIDTGILPTHWEFDGRAFPIYDAVEGQGDGIDCNGHGTHVAGIIGGRTFGVAKRVNLFGVRVLNCAGTGSWAGVIDGINFVTWHRNQPNQQGQAAVANVSLGGEANSAVDVAVRNSIRARVTYVVAAGNANTDASTYSPARVGEAITVGATDPNDFRAEFSNYGSVLDLFAPGVGITSAWIGDNLMIAPCSGTSMAAPHVAGVAALYLQSHQSAAPAAVRQALAGNSTVGVVNNPGSESPNRLLFTNY
jgi:subtilisin family serine protease